ncbi:OB-fold domain-containing protein [Frankia sp. CNm7]|uniref:OB-fold domain-containing protein n=1 Tax=Frankia nepalensis TaxID=1836974 RepID=A0A937RI69_9ACTN|nr:OB-fold domain-containing protein [Frankia nepalensis]MBL7498468.1 OB-fold domain-containing protein [Frankia nepalensis]MBL7509489.1 OB-fold domain-containing protein [Frankia nepalensis]MBL7520748.1 OB-fold domain-containing protein [Frankia nepalensis]MBL7629299.1 OB-fold domain-containing protein [Frankia nepalensis]
MTTYVESTVRFPYKRSLGPVIGQFMTGLTEARLLGIRADDRVIVPPVEWDPETGEQLAHEFVEVGPAGTVRSWCWVEKPTTQHPLDRPFAFALIELDGASTGFLHAVDAGRREAMTTGMRVVPRWRTERRGHITDVEAFVPGDQPLPVERAEPAGEPVTMMTYDAEVHYLTPVTENETRVGQAAAEGRFLGLRCPRCARLYVGGKNDCPICAVALTPQDEVDLPQRGTITNYVIITPVQYPGQTETEPFARVHVLLDGVDVVLMFQPVVDLANDDVRPGVRVSAVWTPPDGTGRRALAGWRPTGEPDVDDPALVNRIH